jgi:DNA replication protein DnaC
MTNPFDYENFFIMFEKAGKHLYGENYTLQKRDMEILMKLTAYFGKQTEKAEELGINLSKGIFLCGPVGAGKTSLIRIFRALLHYDLRFLIKPCRDISYEFSSGGMEVIFKYSKKHFNKAKPCTICFDDLGLEPNSSFFGIKANIMREIILSRYDLFIVNRMITHFTTNFDVDEIENNYGFEVRSRIREMCNIISFHKDTPDKRA